MRPDNIQRSLFSDQKKNITLFFPFKLQDTKPQFNVLKQIKIDHILYESKFFKMKSILKQAITNFFFITCQQPILNYVSNNSFQDYFCFVFERAENCCCFCKIVISAFFCLFWSQLKTFTLCKKRLWKKFGTFRIPDWYMWWTYISMTT